VTADGSIVGSGVTAVVSLSVALLVLIVARPSAPARSAMSLARGVPTSDDGSRRARPSSALLCSRRRRARQIDDAMPDLLDLLVLTLQAGLPAPAAFATLGPYVPDALAPAVDAVVQRHARGERFVSALDALADHLGTRALALVAAISAAERSGLPLAPTVDRIADDARAHRRRSAEIEARRLPVRLAVPLVCCTLPSFVCIAIGPVLVGALSSLRSV
jgi:tight adherence protein C